MDLLILEEYIERLKWRKDLQERINPYMFRWIIFLKIERIEKG